ncbi:MAG: amidohydrolase family protein [Burkholderiaceae bacterium]
MEIVDAHHHLWDLERNFYPWLKEAHIDRGWGDVSELKKSYLASHLLADARQAGVELVKSVHVQASFDPSNPVGETLWLEQAAGEPGCEAIPAAIVGWADLSRDDLVPLLEGHKQASRTRGIRQVLNRHPNPVLNRAPRDFLSEDGWRKGYAVLARYGLRFDAQIYHHQHESLYELAKANPEIPVVLDHICMPAERDPENLAGWHQAIAKLATLPHMMIKLSGFGMVDNHWTAESIRPLVMHCIDCFGPQRAMFASNFPVDKLMASYGRMWAAFAEIAAPFSEAERHALFRGSAERFYDI